LSIWEIVGNTVLDDPFAIVHPRTEALMATQISEVMTRDPKMVTPNDSVQKAAQLMQQSDCGIIPVQDGDQLVGMITDRDIAVRCVAAGKGSDCKVSEAMSKEVLYCFEDQEVEDVADNMAEIQVRRLPVLNRDKRLVGIVSIGDLARHDPAVAGESLNAISEPSERHRQ
jgi:CBS domain-containing protein